jgi:glycosyltransferase involved in cell wall biosynthesis
MAKRKTVGLFSPYVPDVIGGGERHFFTVAETLSQLADTTVLIPETRFSEKLKTEIPSVYGNAFSLDLSQVRVASTLLGTSANAFQKLLETQKYDVLYYVTDGSIFPTFAKKSIVHVQFPFSVPHSGFIDKAKWNMWTVNTNSEFTKKVIERAWQIPVSFIHYPYVDIKQFYPQEKEKIILSVGRFFSGKESGLHCKRQDVLVNVFRELIDEGKLQGWKLVFIGAVDKGEDNEQYFSDIEKRAKGYPIKILRDLPFDMLRRYYSRATLYWHAAGFEIDEHKDPLKVEHFGIAPLEAMASGTVPFVVKKGGLPEVVQSGAGFLWNTKEELKSQTLELVGNPSLLSKMSQAARIASEKFSKERFIETTKRRFL